MKKHFQGQHVLSPVRPGALGITVALFFFFLNYLGEVGSKTGTF